MNRVEAATRLKGHDAELKKLGVQRPFLFGSTARIAARSDSDVDLFFDYEQGKIGVYELAQDDPPQLEKTCRDALALLQGKGGKISPVDDPQ